MNFLSRITEREIRKHLIRRGRNGTFVLRWMIGGYPIYRSMHTADERQAIRFAGEIISALEQRRPSKMLLSGLRDAFIEQNKFSVGYKSTIRTAFNSFIEFRGDAKLSAIRKKDALEFKSILERKVKRVDPDSNKTIVVSGYWVNGVQRILRSAFNFAVEMEWLIGENPFARFRKSDEMIRLAHSYRPEEVRMILDKAREMFGENFSAVIEIYLLTGMRREEAVKIETRMLDFGAGILTLPAEITKKKRERIIPLSARAASLFQQLSAQGPRPINWNKNTISHYFGRVRDALGLTGKFHDIRKTTNTWLADVGLVDVYREKLLGHVDKGVNARNYTSYEIETMRDALEKVAEKLWQVEGERLRLLARVPITAP